MKFYPPFPSHCMFLSFGCSGEGLGGGFGTQSYIYAPLHLRPPPGTAPRFTYAIPRPLAPGLPRGYVLVRIRALKTTTVALWSMMQLRIHVSRPLRCQPGGRQPLKTYNNMQCS